MFAARAILISLLLVATALAQPSIALHLKVPMRDGIKLCTNVFRPASTGRFPVVLQRTPYRKVSELTAGLRAFTDHGYVVVTQDVRGRYDSEGVFQQFIQEKNDGEDTLSWIARQPWCDGRVGMFGGSYVGLVQWRAALSGHPALKTIAPAVSGGDEYTDRYYSRGGAFRLGHRLRWLAENYKPPQKPVADFQKMATYLPLRRADRFLSGRTLDFFQAVTSHPSYDDYWRALSTRLRIDRVRLPVHLVAGWFDVYAPSDLEMWSLLRAAGRPARIVIGPWGHSLSPGMPQADFGPAAAISIRRLEVEWFDAYLKRSAPPPESAVRYFVLGQNEWRESPTWPPRGLTPTAAFLHSETGANSLNGDGRLLWNKPKTDAADRYDYDPRKAVPTHGGATCCTAKIMPWGPFDQRPVEGRRDVLVYTSDPLRQPLEITGPVRAALFVASSAPDTDFMAKLVDVAPSGFARILCEGMIRMRYRQGLERIAPYTPGQIERVEIDLGPISNVFLSGHRLRLEVTSSNFPKYDRNLNTGRPQADGKEMRTARQQVHHGPLHPSQLILPVIRIP
jgi:putative CocE/NonD family hydrolase